MVQEYQKGEHVRYGTSGVCLIEDVREIVVGKEKDLYYVLHPLRDRHSTFYIPVYNPTLTERMQRLVTQDEIRSMIESARSDRSEWIEDRKQRTEEFRELLRVADPYEMLRLCGLLTQKKMTLAQSGKKLSPTDEGVLKQAEQLIQTEFGLVLGISADEVRDCIYDADAAYAVC